MANAEKKTEERVDFLVSSSPHMHSGESIRKIMWQVVGAMVPAMAVAIVFYGLHAVNVLVVTTAACVGFEALFQWLRKDRIRVADGSAVVTGVLLALNLPPSSPWWMCIIGAFIAIGIAKELYGGIGYNPFNPALVARVALLISFPTQMTSWSPTLWMPPAGADAVTTATPLGMIKEHLLTDGTTGLQMTWDYFWRLMIGNVAGSLGETSVLALLLGGLFLLWKGYIDWRVPVSFIGTVFVFTGVAFLFNPTGVASPVFHVISGGLVLGAFFMATDMVTSPVTRKGMIIFGIGCGVITAVIRLWGGYPEGVSFAILIMNATVPLLDRYFKPDVFGERRKIYEVAK
jgi:Na+-translocating ferredoxin:NAD+ oxidoreductase subunit D